MKLILVVAVLLVAGCASTLDSHVSQCLMMERTPTYMVAGNVTKFECQGS